MRCCIIFFLIFLPSVAFAEGPAAKRRIPEPPQPVLYQDIQYSVSPRMGYLEVYNTKTGRQREPLKVFEVPAPDPRLEADVQDVFITGLKVEENTLFVTDDRQREYSIDLVGLSIKDFQCPGLDQVASLDVQKGKVYVVLDTSTAVTNVMYTRDIFGRVQHLAHRPDHVIPVGRVFGWGDGDHIFWELTVQRKVENSAWIKLDIEHRPPGRKQFIKSTRCVLTLPYQRK